MQILPGPAVSLWTQQIECPDASYMCKGGPTLDIKPGKERRVEKFGVERGNDASTPLVIGQGRETGGRRGGGPLWGFAIDLLHFLQASSPAQQLDGFDLREFVPAGRDPG